MDTKNALDIATKNNAISGNVDELKKIVKHEKMLVEEAQNEVARLKRLNAKFQHQLEDTQKEAQDKV